MRCARLPLPGERRFSHLLASGFAANRKTKEVKCSTKKGIASFLPSSSLLLVPRARREREEIKRSTRTPGNARRVDAGGCGAAAACNGHGRCSGFGTGISHTCFASSCLSSSNPDCARISQQFPWQSTHICFSTPRASPRETQQARFPSPPIHRQISLPLALSNDLEAGQKQRARF